jgi:hypothetical protein
MLARSEQRPAAPLDEEQRSAGTGQSSPSSPTGEPRARVPLPVAAAPEQN